MGAAYRVGTAGWTIPRQVAAAFPEGDSHLARYAARFNAVEINSSFYRPHRPSTYARWADTVPDGFEFAIKLPREITHTRKLVDAEAPLDIFLAQATALGDRFGPLLVQLPPGLSFDHDRVERFMGVLRSRLSSTVVCEPRHSSWFADEVDVLLESFEVARVAADPAPVPRAAVPGGWPGLTYRRLHGSPQMYASAYEDTFLDVVAETMRSADSPAWCVFDNTAAGEAAGNALGLAGRLF